MRFNPNPLEEPEINLIPFIDVLLVILIFLMLTTTYSRYTTLRVNLPTASAQAGQQEQPEQPVVSVASDGRYAVGGQAMEQRSAEAIADALSARHPGEKTILVISADAAAPVQAVVTAMDAARRIGLSHISFAAQTGAATTD